VFIALHSKLKVMLNQREKTEQLKNRLFEFSLNVIVVYRELNSKKEFAISNQLVRSATSIGANYQEASAAQSKRDFISKVSISSKECRETNYWLRSLDYSKLYEGDLKTLIEESDQLCKIFTSIVLSATRNLANSE
jgi:four helix bundle protein